MDESREELYRMVWAEPMSLVAPKLGISDVALKKRCASLGVPTPPRGYWAKLQAGQSVKKSPLPASWTAPRKKNRTPKSAEDVEKLDPPDIDYKLSKYPPAVLTTKQSLRAARTTYYGVLECLDKGALKTRVSSGSVDRALWLWTELLRLLALRGVGPIPDGHGVTDGIEGLVLELKEMVGKYEPERPTPKKPDRLRFFALESSGPAREWTPTGVLVFRAEEVHGADATRQWRETAARRMEDRLEEVADGVAVLLVKKHERELAVREAREHAEERQRIKAEEGRRREHEQARRRKLERLASSMDRAERVRRLAQAVEERSESVDADAFVTWALAHADRLDPIADLLADLRKGKDPMEPEHEDRYPPSEAGRRW